ncbi:class I SAM-dependent RNA methyltransferase [Alteriqipengyuania flavescens]|uniref:class I SAM-dependent RNA methyltransferase n=1 Tax=Alteriqipengyuania flavescens TaxID=3053610 RepID=UPI0025B4EB93|nr:class I SAM-dependent RNA methyltransferase [Alteriqipengyuania flavescens]WJY18476.1 class I SAM-dependent RNA methyltransferase [Alteriqipengyuania flavescens]WJY24417.1 class I SAM-dependent RNA methyltransferase [Alteriqipengyuania flavescens]
MSEAEKIIRIAARGDGVTTGGNHVAGGVTGDTLLPDGSLERGPHHVDPPCRHFERCGGCQLQHMDEDILAEFVRSRVANAAEGQGLPTGIVTSAHLSPPKSRRRATLHAINGGGRPVIGFREARSHQVVDLKECHVLAPELFALVEPLRQLLSHWPGKYACDIDLACAEQGVACDIRKLTFEGLDQTQALLDFAQGEGLARLTIDQGYGTEAIWEPEPVSVDLGGISVGFPAGAFLQATADGEAALVGAAREWLADCARIADLFSGLGTFAFALRDDAKIDAYEASRDSSLACLLASRRRQAGVEAYHRDLFRNPLRAGELAPFDGVVLDPPRAGAKEQVGQLAASAVPRVVYVSCNPQSWAKDAKVLVEGGYELREIRPVGQFRWSTHVELVSFFERRD